MSELELLNAAHTGDARAANTLAEAYLGLVRHIAHEFFYPGAEFDDIVQYGLIGLTGGIRTWDPGQGTPVRHFLCTCIRNRILEGLIWHRRKKHLHLNESCSLDEALPGEESGSAARSEFERALATSDDPCDTVIASETLRETLAAFGRLSTLERSVTVGFLAEGKSYHQLALERGVGLKTIDNALQRAKRKIPRLAAA